MKKLISILALACFLSVCVPAFADVSDGSPLTMYGITLKLEAGMNYTVEGSTISDFDITVYPIADNQSVYVNAGWIGTKDGIVEELKSQRQVVEDQYRQMFSSYGLTPTEFSVSPVQDAVLASYECVFYDVDVVLSLPDGSSVAAHQRMYYFPEAGHVLSVITEDLETRDRIIQWLDGAVSF